ncbi:uncharacterized protein LOC117595339 isoform X2 [Esox lucius]|uniref:uncharacterized protein LOC117595339 isoform X2 n=1 Tax=Esox lucius TaxID=8010 RepID=UPI0014771B0D|nr:uncharacterized protein LOC117595339 isoform X2 [Esox lucius]
MNDNAKDFTMITPLFMFVQVIPPGIPVSVYAKMFYNISQPSDVCGQLEYDVLQFTCCDGKLHNGPRLSCCGSNAFSITQASCCQGQLTVNVSQLVSDCCGYKAYDPLNYLCCNTRILKRNKPYSKCCGKEVFDSHQLCCGVEKIVLTKISSNHKCCGNQQYDNKRQCCNYTVVTTRNLDGQCHVSNDTMITKPALTNRPNNCPPGEKGCGGACYYPTTEQCCNTSFQGPYPSGQKCYQGQAAYCGSSYYNPEKETCCAGSVKNRVHGNNLCCGTYPYSVVDEDRFCCNQSLSYERKEGKRCSRSGHLYQPDSQLVCESYVNRPGNHCCGKTTYDPQTEICCNGHRHGSFVNVSCCGKEAYNRSSGEKKCCAGTLYDLPLQGQHTNESQCCGSVLMEAGSTQTCCFAPGLALVYTTQPGFSCCGHLYPNTSLWSCCAGVLQPWTERQTRNHNESPGPRLLQLEDLYEDVCHNNVYIGTVETVSVRKNQMSVVMKNAVFLMLSKNQVRALSNPEYLRLSDHCSSPELVPGNTYIWMKANRTLEDIRFISDISDHPSPIYSILSMCSF